MSRDLLDQFRGQAGRDKVVPGPARVIYEPFKISTDRQYRLKIRPALRAWERINYSYLQRIVEDGIYGTEIGLIFSFAVILIKGRNLHPIADAIDREVCEFVQQFDSSRWPRPGDEKATLIERIEIHVQTRNSSTVEAADQVLTNIEATRKNPPVS